MIASQAPVRDVDQPTGRGDRLSVYLPQPMREEIVREAARLRRGISFVVRLAWTLARDRVKALPDVPVSPRETPVGERLPGTLARET